MKQINDPGPIKLVDVFGNPIPGEEGKQAEATLATFLLGLTGTPEFVGDLKGIDAAVAVLEARTAIQAWPAGPGPKPCETEIWKNLCRAIRTATFNQPIAHNLVPCMRAVLDAKDVPAALAQSAAQAAE